MSPNLKKIVDVTYIIARIFDGSKFLEYKKNYGTTLVTGFAKLYGQDVGILANNGMLMGESAQKGVNFIEICSEVC
jgi:3-methylcrotonyl-CoA carboxylase beta subunit